MLVDRELLIRPAPQRTTLGHALNLLGGAAMRFRDCFGSSDPAWSLIGFFAHRRLLTGPAAAPQLKFASRRGLAMPGATRHLADETLGRACRTTVTLLTRPLPCRRNRRYRLDCARSPTPHPRTFRKSNAYYESDTKY